MRTSEKGERNSFRWIHGTEDVQDTSARQEFKSKIRLMCSDGEVDFYSHAIFKKWVSVYTLLFRLPLKINWQSEITDTWKVKPSSSQKWRRELGLVAPVHGPGLWIRSIERERARGIVFTVSSQPANLPSQLSLSDCPKNNCWFLQARCQQWCEERTPSNPTVNPEHSCSASEKHLQDMWYCIFLPRLCAPLHHHQLTSDQRERSSRCYHHYQVGTLLLHIWGKSAEENGNKWMRMYVSKSNTDHYVALLNWDFYNYTFW